MESVSKFSFRFQSLQVSKGIESILRMETLQETMLGKQDPTFRSKAMPNFIFLNCSYE